MKLERFKIKVDKDGEMVFNSPSHKHLFKKFLQQFSDKNVFLEVKEAKSQRTLNQNSYYWLYLGIIAEETGYSKDELHDLFKGKFLTKEIKEVLGEKVRIEKSTSTLSIGKFVEYIIDIEQFTGIQAPDTSEYWGFSYHRPY